MRFCRSISFTPSQWFASVLLCVLCLSVLGCDGGYAKPIAGGYELVRTNAGTIVIYAPDDVRASHPSWCDPAGIVVAAKVEYYAVSGAFILGHVVESQSTEFASIQRPGYFLLNTSTGELMSGLDVPEWEQHVRAAGIDPSDLKWIGT